VHKFTQENALKSAFLMLMLAWVPSKIAEFGEDCGQNVYNLSFKEIPTTELVINRLDRCQTKEILIYSLNSLAF
jgi:hypothetical protein